MTKTIQEMNYQYFMEADIGKYSGEWIAILEDKILAHGRNLKMVVEKARALSGGKKFLLARVPSEEAMIF